MISKLIDAALLKTPYYNPRLGQNLKALYVFGRPALALGEAAILRTHCAAGDEIIVPPTRKPPRRQGPHFELDQAPTRQSKLRAQRTDDLTTLLSLVPLLITSR